MAHLALLAQPCRPLVAAGRNPLASTPRLARPLVRQVRPVLAAAINDAPTPKKAAPVKKGKDPNRAFVQKQSFVVPEAVQPAFEAEWKAREAGMQGAEGFNGFEMTKDGETYTCISKWARIPDWEAYSLSPVARRSHLPLGIWQRVPKVGDGFPEDFVPFVDMETFVNAKYK